MVEHSSASAPRLTEEQVQFYRDNGYLVVHGITTVEELAGLRQIYDRLFAERAGRERGDQFDLAGADEEGAQAKLPQILAPSNYAPEMRDTLAWRNVQSVVAQLLDLEDVGLGDHAILKPAKHGAATPWHQDEAYWDPGFDYRSLSVWIPLQDTDETMGCLSFVPGSHRLPIQAHRPIGGDVRVHGLELDPKSPVDLSGAVSVPLKAGSCTIHDARTLHFAPGNHSDEPRRAWILGGGAPATPRLNPPVYPWQESRQTAREARAQSAAKESKI